MQRVVGDVCVCGGGGVSWRGAGQFSSGMPARLPTHQGTSTYAVAHARPGQQTHGILGKQIPLKANTPCCFLHDFQAKDFQARQFNPVGLFML